MASIFYNFSAVDKGVYYTDSRNQGLAIESPDVAVVNVLTPGSRPSVIPVPLKPIKAVDGMAFNLFNNIWDVNFIFWYPFEKRDVNQKFRFKLNISPAWVLYTSFVIHLILWYLL